MIIPITSNDTPLISATDITVCTASLTLSSLPCPIKFAIITFAPIDNPTNIFISKLITGLFPPTAAKAALPANLPTTATSAELNNCCRMLLAANGSAKNNIL